MINSEKVIKNILGNKIKVPRYGKPHKNDLDGDGILNKMDCQPRNVFRQDKFQGWDKTDKSYELPGFPDNTKYYLKGNYALYITDLGTAFIEDRGQKITHIVGLHELNKPGEQHTKYDKGFSNEDEANDYLVSLMIAI